MALKAPSLVMTRGAGARPHPPNGTVLDVLRRLYGLTLNNYQDLESYDDRNYHAYVTNEWTNKHIAAINPHGYVLKIMNTNDSRMALNMDGQIALMNHMKANGIYIQEVVKTVSGSSKTLEKIKIVSPNQAEGFDKFGDFMVRLFTFVPGQMIKNVNHTPVLMYKVGKFVGKFDNILKTFSHPGFEDFDHIWTLNNIPHLKNMVHVVKDEKKNKLILDVIKAYETEVAPILTKLPLGMIHGDPNELNIIVEGHVEDSKNHRITILDFGDAVIGYYLWEVAVLIMYMMLDSTDLDPMLVGGHLLAGYLTKIPLNETEWDNLHVCVACRFAQSLTFGLFSYAESHDEYVLTTAKSGWKLLEKFWRTPKEEIYADWKRIIANYK